MSPVLCPDDVHCPRSSATCWCTAVAPTSATPSRTSTTDEPVRPARRGDGRTARRRLTPEPGRPGAVVSRSGSPPCAEVGVRRRVALDRCSASSPRCHSQASSAAAGAADRRRAAGRRGPAPRGGQAVVDGPSRPVPRKSPSCTQVAVAGVGALDPDVALPRGELAPRRAPAEHPSSTSSTPSAARAASSGERSPAREPSSASSAVDQRLVRLPADGEAGGVDPPTTSRPPSAGSTSARAASSRARTRCPRPSTAACPSGQSGSDLVGTLGRCTSRWWPRSAARCRGATTGPSRPTPGSSAPARPGRCWPAPHGSGQTRVAGGGGRPRAAGLAIGSP